MRDADEFERLIPDARKVVCADTGHVPMLERPAAFNALLEEFLGERARRSGRRSHAAVARSAQVTAPSAALADELRVLRQHAACSSACARRLVGRDAARRSRRRRASTSMRRRVDVDRDLVAVARRAAIGPPRAASGATWPAMKPWVAPEKRPSVSSATCSPRPSPTIAAVTREHLAHAGAAGRALVADHDDVARAGSRRAVTAAIAASSPSNTRAGPRVAAALVAGELHDAAVGREVAAQDREAAGRLERVVERAHDVLAGRLAGLVGVLADRAGR